jgi:glutathione peroxidase
MKKLIGAICLMSAALFGASSVYEFTLNSIDGQPMPLQNFQGKVMLIVNVASKCGFTPQYEGLEAVYEKYKDQGFVIVGFPANNFMGQEPGTNEEIKTFCSTKYNVKFPPLLQDLSQGRGQSAFVSVPHRYNRQPQDWRRN